MTIRRIKTYTGAIGYVYQYYFVGQRSAPTSKNTEYIFDVTSDRTTTYSVSVILSVAVTAAWGEAHGRALSGAEQYAAVKMRLFRAFDELEDMSGQGRRLQVELEFLEEALTELGVE
jgi:hypothetical protein